MATELFQLSLSCVGYENLLADIVLVKCIIECNPDGTTTITGPVGDIMKALFGTATTGINLQTQPVPPANVKWVYTFVPNSVYPNPPNNTTGFWYHTLGNLPFAGHFLIPPLTPPFPLALTPPDYPALPSNYYVGFSCFNDLSIYYFTKSCKTDYVIWNPSTEDCIGDALQKIKELDGYWQDPTMGYTPTSIYPIVPPPGYIGYVRLGFTTNPATVPQDFSPFTTFAQISNLFSEFFVRIFNDANPTAISLQDMLLILNGFCALLKTRIEIEKKMKKSYLTIGECDLP